MGIRTKTSIQPIMKAFKKAGLTRQTFERVPGRDLYRVNKRGDFYITRTYDKLLIEIEGGLGTYREILPRYEERWNRVEQVLKDIGAEYKTHDESHFEIKL